MADTGGDALAEQAFRLVNEQGESTFVRFHWTPKLGT